MGGEWLGAPFNFLPPGAIDIVTPLGGRRGEKFGGKEMGGKGRGGEWKGGTLDSHNVGNDATR